ncbi:hypothetical protein B9G69_006715 [Bdellovibrio sp. SKB1291214]|uniref:hypothetical protein n=1 Tax=Bdellovibrio sp. SKB1291214 TaxID=1732569 RepID=UPI000B51D8A8|nr:hypothetical protein [Bdellovibrio sp. SKB1291214]UYL10270.1 hypothetical protein B9G69_006715 [Bdellovibrio sp. SKB1291214]
MKLILDTFKAILFFGLIFNGAFAMADGMGKLALLYYSADSKDNGADSKSSRMVYDVGLYYKFQGGGWVLGGLYQNDSTSVNGVSTPRTSYGLSGGYMTNKEMGGYIIATYFISSVMGDYNEGSGYQVDLGYKFTPRRIPLAFQISYKNYDYPKFNHSDTKMDPYFVVILDF